MIKIKIGNQEVWMQACDDVQVPGISKINTKALVGQNLHTAEEISNTIRAYSSKLIQSFRELQNEHPPKRVVAEFGLSLTPNGEVFIVNNNNNAGLKVTVEWAMDGYDKL